MVDGAVGAAVGEFPLLSAPAAAQGLMAGALKELLAGLRAESEASSAAHPRVGPGREVVAQALVATAGLLGTVQAAYLHLVALAEASEPLAERLAGRGVRSGAATKRFLVDVVHRSPGDAARDLAAARAIDPIGRLDVLARALVPKGQAPRGSLTGLGEALAAGEVSREHVDVAVAAVRSFPASIVEERGDEIDAALTARSRAICPASAGVFTDQVAATVAPDGLEASAEEAADLRRASMGRDRRGMLSLSAHLDPAGAAIAETLLGQLADPGRPLRAHHSGCAGLLGEVPEPGDDGRTMDQRRADAMVEVFRLAWVGMKVDNPTAEPAHVVIHTSEEQLAHPDGSGSLHPHLQSCDGGESVPDGECAARGFDDGGAEAEIEPDDGTETASDTETAPGERVPAAGAQARPRARVSARRLAYAAGSATTNEGSEPTGVSLSCSAPGAATLEGGAPLAMRTLHALACDAVIHRVVLDRHGAVVRMETAGHLANRAQRRALAARDGGCAFPGCGAPPSWCDAHHIRWWSRGGATVIENLCLLCQAHHSEIHRERWAITMINGVPWFIPPATLDPERRPRRNTTHTLIGDARRTGHALLSGQPLSDALTRDSAA